MSFFEGKESISEEKWGYVGVKCWLWLGANDF